MRCRTCDYPLWNNTTRLCPECGTRFRPSEYEFTPNSVRFCCPHCDEAYYGVGERGHLEPRAFVCAGCGRNVRENEMIVRPVEGVDEADTHNISAPWIDRRGDTRWHAFLTTTGLALVQPHRLMRGVPVNSSVGRSVGYAMVVAICTWIIALVPMLALFFMLPFALGGLGGGITVGQSMLVGVIQLGVMIVFLWMLTMAFIAIWTVSAHLILTLTGGASESIGRTCHALCYSSGANIVSGIPCVGYLIGPVWWMVSAVIMLREAHRTSIGRAVVAVIVVPILLVVTSMTAYIAWIMFVLSSQTGPFGASSFDPARADAIMVRDRLVAYAESNEMGWPRHGLELVPAGGLGPGNFISTDWQTSTSDVPVAGGTLADMQTAGPNRRLLMAQAAADALPEDVVAHRVGDFVFVHHGIDLTVGDGELWLVVLAPDPVVNVNAPSMEIHVGLLGGPIEIIDARRRTEALAEQNALRTAAGLASLPDPFTVTHDAPAGGAGGSLTD